MRVFSGLVLAGLVITTAGAQAQMPAPYRAVSDFNGPYAAMPPEPPVPEPGYGYGPTLLPPQEVYTVVRENGFSPLGIPHQRGFVYTIGVIDHRGENGRLVIDARSGRVIRFVPGYEMGYNAGVGPVYRAPVAYSVPAYRLGTPVPPLPINADRSALRPPVDAPKMASRTPDASLPKASASKASAPKALARIEPIKPLVAKPAATTEPKQQSAAVQMKPAETPAPVPATPPAVVEAKPAAPQILPTQEMPKVQGLE